MNNRIITKTVNFFQDETNNNDDTPHKKYGV